MDTIAPAAPSPPDLDSVADDTGRSQTDNITNLASLTFGGSAEAGAIVQLYNLGRRLAAAPVTADGRGRGA